MYRLIKTLTSAALATGMSIGAAFAADWTPDGAITMHVGFGAGGSTDALSRAIAKSIEDANGWDVVVENLPGAGGVAMLSKLQAMDPDGLNIGVGVTIPVWIQLERRGDQLPFTLESFDWLATMGRAGLAMTVAADGDVKSMADLIEKAKSGGVTVATNGPAQELIVRALAKETGGDFKPVPTKSGGEIIQNLLGGHVDAATLGGAHVEYVQNGDMILVAGLAPVRDGADTNVPTLMEMGYPLSIDASFYIAAPAGLSDDAKNAMSDAISAALESDGVGEALSAMGMEGNNLGPDGTAQMIVDGQATVSGMIAASQ
ncbi:Bug family tripartite tricarboxylate transporter substrate binding protein [Ruegeria sp.]|uniref:Bug family tripartite tricarboxylate transporter substrate binding protein n=1 Tax=Ruegeria sp. TaxID=1879320 RepID=UPI003AFFBAC8